jgi:hypothetical protein
MFGAGCARGHAQGPIRTPDHGDVAVPVGPQDPGTRSAEPVEKRGIRVTVGVVRTYAHHGDLRVRLVQQARVLVDGAMMGHLDHIDPQPRGVHIGQ